jgi:hypothetical protein
MDSKRRSVLLLELQPAPSSSLPLALLWNKAVGTKNEIYVAIMNN